MPPTKIVYDEESQILVLEYSEGVFHRDVELQPGLYVSYNKDDSIASLEIHGVSPENGSDFLEAIIG